MDEPQTLGLKQLAGIFLLGILIRFICFIPLHDTFYMGGTQAYHGLVARSYIEGKGVSIPIGAIVRFEQRIQAEGRPPVIPAYSALPWEETDTFFPMIRYASLYSILLGTYISAVPDFQWVHAQIPQMALDAFAAIWIACAAIRLGLRRRGALAAGVFYAVSVQLARNSLAIFHDGPSPAAMALAIWIFSVAVSSDGPRFLVWSFLAGLAIAFAAYLRPNVMLLPFFLAAALTFVRPGRPVLRFFIPMMIAFVLAIAPQTVRNYRMFGAFLPLTASVSTNLMLDLNGWRTDWDVARSEPGAPNTSELHYPDPIARDALRTKMGLEYLRAHKREYLEVTVKRRLKNLLFSPWKIGFLQSESLKSAITSLIHAQEAFFYFLFGVGLWAAVRTRSPVLLPAVIPVYFFMTLIPMHTEARYFWPALPALYLAAGDGFDRICARFKS